MTVMYQDNSKFCCALGKRTSDLSVFSVFFFNFNFLFHFLPPFTVSP